MDTLKKADSAHLLDDLESIRKLLGNDNLQPPLLTETVRSESRIPLLHGLIDGQPPASEPPAPPVALPTTTLRAPVPQAQPQPQAQPDSPPLHDAGPRYYLETELRAAAQLIMQDVIDDFAPHIETEIRRRLEARLERLVAASTGKS